MKTDKDRIDRFYKLYRKGRRENAPQGFIDYFEASHFLLKEIDKALVQQREEIVEMIKRIKGTDDKGAVEFVKKVILTNLTKKQ